MLLSFDMKYKSAAMIRSNSTSTGPNNSVILSIWIAAFFNCSSDAPWIPEAVVGAPFGSAVWGTAAKLG